MLSPSVNAAVLSPSDMIVQTDRDVGILTVDGMLGTMIGQKCRHRSWIEMMMGRLTCLERTGSLGEW